MARQNKSWVNFQHDPENAFHNMVAIVAEEVDQDAMNLFLFHQLRTEFDPDVMFETRDPKGQGKVMNYDAAKIVKGEKKGILSGVVYLAAGNSSGIEVCPHRTGKFPTWRHPDHPGSNIIFGAKNKNGQCVSLKNAKFHLSDPERASEFMKDIVDQANNTDKPLEAMALLGKNGFKKDAGCSGLCLGHTAGHARVAKSKLDDLESNPVQATRIARTRKLLGGDKAANEEFLKEVERDINALVRKADRQGMKPAVRLNGTSDLYWHRMAKLKKDGKTFFELFPNVQFYDYTKNFDVAIDHLEGKLPSNYHITYSFGGSNWPEAKKILDKGGNVAVGFRLAKKHDFPLKWRGYTVVDGDDTDLRFADPKSKPGNIIGLRTKGSSFNMNSNFIVEPDDAEIEWPEDSPFHPSAGGKGVKEINKMRKEREQSANKHAITSPIQDDIKELFSMIKKGEEGINLRDISKSMAIPMDALKTAYKAWSDRWDYTGGNMSKTIGKDAGKEMTAKHIGGLIQKLAERKRTYSKYEASRGKKGQALINHVKGKIQEESFASFMGLIVENIKSSSNSDDLNETQKRALQVLKNQYNRARKPGVDLSMQWVAPSAYDMKAATFEYLCKRGLAERKMSPGKGSNRWYYRWVKPLGETMENMTFFPVNKAVKLVAESPRIIKEERKSKAPVKVVISAKDNMDKIEQRLIDAVHDAMDVDSEREDFDVDYVPYGDTRVPMGSKGSVESTTVRQDRPIHITVKDLKKGDEVENFIPEELEVEVETDYTTKTVYLSLEIEDTKRNVVSVTFKDVSFEEEIED